MSGGIVYIYNQNKNINSQINPEMVFIDKISDKDKDKIKNILINHKDLTKSKKAEHLLNNFDKEINSFIRVIPKEIYKILESHGIKIDDFDFMRPKLN